MSSFLLHLIKKRKDKITLKFQKSNNNLEELQTVK